MKKILVPVDFSPSSKLAVEYALAMAERTSAGIHVLHAWEVPAYLRPDLMLWVGDVSATLADHVWHEAEKAMKAFLEDAKVTGRSDVTFEVVAGQPLATIMSAIETGTYDFIAMGTHGRSGFSHLALGSVAERVVRHSKLPVLTVHARQGSAVTMTMKRLLVPTDYSEHSKRAFSMAADLAKEFGGSIELLHVWPATGSTPARFSTRRSTSRCSTRFGRALRKRCVRSLHRSPSRRA
jgi:nucleotide-binding universal stress UspA family protein